LRGISTDAKSPIVVTTAKAIIASAYERPGVEVIPATRMVPAMAVPRHEPRLDTLRDRPEISPCRCSGKLDWTTFTEGVSIPPSPSPMISSPGAKVQTFEFSDTISSKRPTPAMLARNPATMRFR